MYENWGFDKLGKLEYEESIEEMKHADMLIKRILFLEGLPEVSNLRKILIGKDIPLQLKNDHSSELGAIKEYNAAIKESTTLGDNGTREILEDILKEEEDHTDWLESQLDQIDQMGIQSYLVEQVS